LGSANGDISIYYIDEPATSSTMHSVGDATFINKRSSSMAEQNTIESGSGGQSQTPAFK